MSLTVVQCPHLQGVEKYIKDDKNIYEIMWQIKIYFYVSGDVRITFRISGDDKITFGISGDEKITFGISGDVKIIFGIKLVEDVTELLI